METSELIKKVRSIEVKTKGLSANIFAGEYESAFKGRGMAFSEVREYQPGDDIRSIDWKVTARFNNPYIKIFEEERELTLMLIIDISASENFGTSDQSKKEVITEIAATLAFSAIQNNDKIGVILFSDKIEKFIPPKKGKSHVLMIIRTLLNFEPEHTKTDISGALSYFANVIKKRCTAFVISDFIDNDIEQSLKSSRNKHDLIGLRVTDSFEEELPKVGMIRMVDAETGAERYIDTNNKTVRSAYRNLKAKHALRIKTAFNKAGLDYTNIKTNESFVKPLIGLFNKR